MHVRRVLTLVAWFTAVFSSVAFADGFKNLQVLPKNTTREELKQVMKGQSKALGVECDFCHEMPDMASDKSDKKQVARSMMRMTDEINAKWFKGNKQPPITCGTCHQGHGEPPKFPPLSTKEPAAATK
jgi:cytochrome c553